MGSKYILVLVEMVTVMFVDVIIQENTKSKLIFIFFKLASWHWVARFLRGAVFSEPVVSVLFAPSFTVLVLVVVVYIYIYKCL